MRKVSKILVIMAVIALVMLPAMCFATDIVSSTITSVENQTAPDTAIINQAGGQIYKLIQTIGIVVALVVVVAFGIQWIVATPAKKAELKGKMWNIVIGIAILLLASVIVGQLGNFFTQVGGGTAAGSNVNPG